MTVHWKQIFSVRYDDLLSQLQVLNRTELIWLFTLLDCQLTETDIRLVKVVLATDTQVGGNMK